MKKFFQIILVAAAALVIASCSDAKEKKVKITDKNAINISVIAQANDLAFDDVQTKTYIDTYQGTPNTILWGTGEYMKLGVNYLSGTEEKTIWSNSSEANANGQPQAAFAFSVNFGNDTPDETSTYTYYGLYPASAAVASSNTTAASYKVNLPATQNATATSYDPAAYIMVAKPETFDEAQTEWLASYRRATALNKVTLKNLPAAVQEAGIKRVEIAVTVNDATKNTYLAGARHIDLTTGESGDIYNGGGRTNTVAVKFANHLAGSANVDVWFTSWGVELEEGDAITVAVFAGDKIYLRIVTLGSGKSVSFKEGYLNTLGVNMGGNDVIVSDNNEFEEGSYVVIVVDGSNPVYALKAEKVSGKQTLVAVGYNHGSVSYSGDADIIWNISKSGDSYIFENNGQYLGYKGSSNESYWLEPGEEWTEDNYLLDITAQETAGQYYVTVHSAPTRYLSKNSSSNFFAFYGNTSQKADLMFVPATVDNRAPVSIAFVDGQINLTTANYASFSGQDVSIDPAVNEVVNNLVWSYENESGVIDETQSEGEDIVLTGNIGYAIVKASFAGSENYRPAEGGYRIEVDDASNLGLSFPFTSAIEGWPAASGSSEAGSYTYPLDGTDYTFTHTKVGNGIYCSSSYLMITKSNYLGLPALEGYKLISVSAQLNSGGNPSTASKGTITSDVSGTVVSGGEEQTFDVKGESKTFNLTGTEANTVYYLAIGSNANFQCTRIELVYTQAASLPDPGMSWSASTASATIYDTHVDFTAPELTLGNAHDVTFNSTDPAVATISNAGVVEILTEGTTTIQAIFGGDANHKSSTVEYTLTVTDERTPAATTISDVLAGGAGTYQLANLLVYAVNGNNVIVGDASGKMLLYMTNTLAVGDNISIADAVTTVYQSTTLEITSGTITVNSSGNAVDHGTPVDLNDETAASSTHTTFSATGNHSAVYVSMTGAQSGQNVTGSNPNTTLHLNAANAATSGRTVNVTGYVYSWSSNYNNYNFQAVSINVDETVPYVSVSPASYTWGAAETDLKQFTVTVNNNEGFTVDLVSGVYADWNITSTSGTKLSVKPKEANTSTTDDKVLVLRVSHSGASQNVTCTQSKVSSGGTPDPETIVFANLGLENGVQYSDPFNGGHFTITFAGGGNDGKYYTSGSGIRTYGDGTITVASQYKIAEIAFTWAGDSYKPTADVASPSGYATSTAKWTGSANSVTLTRPSGSGHWRLQSVIVTYE